MADILTELDRWWPVLGILATLVYGWGVYHLSRRFRDQSGTPRHAKTVTELGVASKSLSAGWKRFPDGKDHARHTAFP